MRARLRAFVTARLNAARARPLNALAWCVAVSVAGYVLVYPFLLVRYPPMTDLPFHAANVSIIRHYLNPAWHFRQQFTLHPFEVPYVTTYGIGVLLSLFMPITWAAKGMAIAMLALLPLGLGVLFYGMKKSPLWGVLGLGFAWTDLSQWGFLNFIGALGLYAMCVGTALLVVDRPSRRRRIALGAALVAVFFTHVFRFPFAVLAVGATGLVMYPATRRFRVLLAPCAPALGLFGLWWLVRPKALRAPLALGVHFARLGDVVEYLFGGYNGATGRAAHRIALEMGIAFVIVCAAGVMLRVVEQRRAADVRERRWTLGVCVLPLLLAAGHLAAYLCLPMSIGVWWDVYPREVVAAAFVLVSVAPDLPRANGWKLALVTLVAFSAGRMAFLVAGQWKDFQQATWDFRAITRLVPRAPKLFYLVFDRLGSDQRASPFLHLPAWIQAEKGGWLDFHFASWGTYPVRYRAPGPNVPPPVPKRWEYTPQRFRVLRQGRFFNVFLTRSTANPKPLFAADKSLHFVAERGTWWLYERRPAR